LVLYAGLFVQIKKVVAVKNQKLPEIITITGFILLFALLSLSKYKLPHYIFVTLPFASIICAIYMDKLTNKQQLIWERIYFAFGVLVAIAITIYLLFFFTEVNYLIYILIGIQLFLLLRSKKLPINGIFRLITYVIVLNVFLSFVFYPKLLTFQADAMAGKWFYENKPNEKVYFVNDKSHLFNFYTKNSKHQSVLLKDLDSIHESCWLYTDGANLSEIQKGKTILETKKFADYPITRLKLDFLLYSKRYKTITYNYLLKIK
jgi:hypothetical protein